MKEIMKRNQFTLVLALMNFSAAMLPGNIFSPVNMVTGTAALFCFGLDVTREVMKLEAK